MGGSNLPNTTTPWVYAKKAHTQGVDTMLIVLKHTEGESTEKVGRGGDIAVFFADYIWALPTFNNRWGALFRCRWGAGVWW